MKKYLLSLITLFMVAIGIKAEIVPAFSTLAEGDFYLYNVEYKGFLVGANDWGTRASVSREGALKIAITSSGSTTYKLGAMSPDNADGVWIDGSRAGNDQFTITAIANNTYAIGCTKFDGTVLTWTGDEANTRLNFTTETTNGTWGLVSPADYDAYLAELAEIEKAQEAENEAKGIYTGRIVNNKVNGADGWTCERPNGGNGPLLNGSAFEYWAGNASPRENGAFNYYQKIAGLPTGKYVLGAEMYNSSNGEGEGHEPNGNAGLYIANGETENFVGVTVDGDKLTAYTTEEIVVNEGDTIIVGVKSIDYMSARWFVADNFTLVRTGDIEVEVPEVTIEENDGIYTVTSTSADAALYYLCKPYTWLEDRETPELVLMNDIEEMGAMIDSEETWELYGHMGMEPAPKSFNPADYEAMYAGQDMFIVAANVGWDGEKLTAISNVAQIHFTVPGSVPAPEIKSITVNPNNKVLAVSFDAEDANPTYSVAFSLETADGIGVNTTVSGQYGENYGDMIYTFGGALNAGDYVLVLPAGSMTFSLKGDPFGSEIRIPFTIEAQEESLIANGNFAKGVVGDVNIATYAKDGDVAQMQEVPDWSFGVENGDAKASGVVAYGSATTLGGAAYTVPTAGPEGTNGNALAVVGVWTGTVQYVQDVTLPAGKYTMTVPVYNTAGTSAFVKNLIGVKYGETEILASTKSYPVGKWIDEIVTFELAEETTVTVSLGYEGANVGSGSSQHLFYDCVNIEVYDEVAVAKAAALAALPVGNESLFTPSAEAVEAVKTAIEEATTVEEVEAAAATEFTIPALSGSYIIQNTTAEKYLGAAILSEEPVLITFEQAEGGFYIKMDTLYINMAGGNTWSMNAIAEANTAWNFNLANGNYTIQGPNGLIGTDNTEAGSATYGNKTADKNGIWSIKSIDLAEGTYAIINLASKTYLNGSNSWGTKASVTKHGQFMTIAKLEDGTYTIDSHYSNGGDKHYLAAGDNTFLDALPAGHTIEFVSEGFYAIKDTNGKYLSSDGVLANFNADEITDSEKWAFLTKDEFKSLCEVAAEPVDFTAFVPDANFSRNNQDINLWEGESKMGKGGPNTAADATAAGMNAEKWGGNSTSIDFHTTIADLPNGKYQVKFQGFYRYNNTTDNTNDVAAAAHADGTEKILSTFSANNVIVPFTSIADETAVELYGKMPFSQAEASEAFTKGAYQNSLEVYVTDGTLTLAVTKNEADHIGCDWTILDNIELYYINADQPAIDLPSISFDAVDGAVIDLAESKSIHVSVALPEGMDESDDLLIEGVVVGKDGTNQPIFGYTDFEDCVDVDLSRLTPGNSYTIMITKVAFGDVIGMDEETYMPIYSNTFVAEEGTALASIGIAIKADAPDAGEIVATYNEAGPVIDIIFKDQTDVAPTFNVDILLDGEKLNCEYGQEWNEVYGYPGKALSAGEHTIVFPVGSLMLNSSVENATEWTVTFTVPEPDAIIGIAADGVADGKYLDENAKVVIVKSGVKYNAAGQIIR